MWRKGNIFPIWDKEHEYFQYRKQPHTAEEDRMWKEAGFNNQSYTGKMYGYPNRMPDYVYEIADQLNLSDCGYNFYRMDRADLMPPHKDHFNTYVENFDVKPKDVLRAVIFLEDSKEGHYFSIGNRDYTFWKAGDYFIWDQSEEHAAGNYGLDPRYTLQITGINRDRKYEDQYRQGLFWKNFDVEPNNLGFIGHQIEINYRFLKDLRDPFFVFTGVGDINFPFIPDDDFTIYLYEPLTFYVPGIKPNMGFYHEPTPDQYDILRALELDSIEKIQLNQNITVKCCDYKVAEHLGKRYPTLNLECDDIFVRSLSHHAHNCKAYVKRQKKFICPNWRYTQHRHLVMNFLANKDGNYSWHFNMKGNLDGDVWVDYTQLDEHIRNQVVEGEKLLRKNEYSLDKTDATIGYEREGNTAWPNGHYGITDRFVYNYRQCFVAVVNETRYSQLTGNFSEKLIDAIKCETPFVLVAPPKTLEYVRSLGFATFNKFWDESYDDEIDPMKRMNKILNVLNDINDHENIEELYYNMRGEIAHNLEHVKTLKEYK